MKTQFITDVAGTKLAVILPIEEYEKLMEELDDLEDVRLYDEAKKEGGGSIPVEEAFDYLDKKRLAQ